MSIEAVIVPKLSRIEWEARDRGVSQKDAIQQLREEGETEEDIEAAIMSQERQKETIAKMVEVLKLSLIDRDVFNQDIADKCQVVFAPGGDNHFQYVARYITGDQTIVGLNTDPKTSNGEILSFRPEHIHYLKECLDRERFETENWPRLQAKLNGKQLPYFALSEIYVGEMFTLGMSKNTLYFQEQKQRHANSGFLVATGAGLSGWCGNVTKHWDPILLRGFQDFSRTDLKARVVSINRSVKSSENICDIKLGEEIILQSQDKHGIVAFDSDPNDPRFFFTFKRGSKVAISIAENHPLRVAVPEDPLSFQGTIADEEGGEKNERSVNYS